jgi:hypothetical protein
VPDAAPLPLPADTLLDHLRALTERIRSSVLDARRATRPGAAHAPHAVVKDAATTLGYSGDTIYAIDERGESALLDWAGEFARVLPVPFTLVAEGLSGDGTLTFPAGATPSSAALTCIVDPIDGTRGLMYDKRSAWVLVAAAPGPAALRRTPTLSDVAVAVQAELPTTRARLADSLWAVAGGGAAGETLDLVTGSRTPFRPAPSGATDLAHGFATIAKFFPGTKELAAWVEERLFAEVVGEHAAGVPLVFDDEYISSGGQLYELMMGHDRFIADLRPILLDVAGARARGTGAPPAAARRLCCRPYDVCTALIAQEAGVAVTDAYGRALAAPLDTSSDVSWVGYANAALRARIEPVLQRLLGELAGTSAAALRGPQESPGR